MAASVCSASRAALVTVSVGGGAGLRDRLRRGAGGLVDRLHGVRRGLAEQLAGVGGVALDRAGELLHARGRACRQRRLARSSICSVTGAGGLIDRLHGVRRGLAHQLAGVRGGLGQQLAGIRGSLSLIAVESCSMRVAERVGRSPGALLDLLGGRGGGLIHRLQGIRCGLAQQLAGVHGVGLDRGRELLHARGERVGGGLGAELDLLGDVLGAADQQLLEAADAGVEGVGDLDARGCRAPCRSRRSARRSSRRAWRRGC